MILSRRRFLFAAPAIVAASSLMARPRPKKITTLPAFARLNSVSVYRHGQPPETWTPPEPLLVGFNERVAVCMDAGRIVGVLIS